MIISGLRAISAFIFSFMLLGSAVSFAQSCYPPGTLRWNGLPLTCGGATTCITPNLDNLGRAAPGGTIYLRSDLNNYGSTFSIFLFSHECAHYQGIMNETQADAFAVCLGKRQGWLNEFGLRQVCAVTLPSRGSWTHLPGPARCAAMIRAYRSC